MAIPVAGHARLTESGVSYRTPRNVMGGKGRGAGFVQQGARLFRLFSPVPAVKISLAVMLDFGAGFTARFQVFAGMLTVIEEQRRKSRHNSQEQPGTASITACYYPTSQTGFSYIIRS